MIRVVIADDEPVARRRIRRLLSGETDVEIVGECGDGRSTVETIQDVRPDLVFLDVQMPEADGFAVLRALQDPLPAVIFVTAFDHYALAAFEVHALDYLLKPFNRTRFEQSLARAREHIDQARQRRTDAGTDERLARMLRGLTERRYLTKFAVRAEGRVRLVDADTVEWIEAADNYVILHAGSSAHAVRDTMNRLEAELDPVKFVRIHRSAIVRIDTVRELLPSFHGDFVVVLHDGSRLDMSRNYRQQVEALLRRRL